MIGWLMDQLLGSHERLVICAQCNRSARMCIEEAIRFARQRRTFGKRLIDHQVPSLGGSR